VNHLRNATHRGFFSKLLEFIVKGAAVSAQAMAASQTAWKARIKEASKQALPEDFFSYEGKVAVTLFYFPAEQWLGDIDNIIKPILDALSQHVYLDDFQVHRVVAQKFEVGNVFGFTSPSSVLLQAVNEKRPLLYVRLSDDPLEDLQ
jgi:crossover junction endodeoxyribonuclease RusA